MATFLLLMFCILSLSYSLEPPLIRPTSWTASDDFSWDSSVEVPKGPGSSKNVLVIPGTVDGLVLTCNASYPVEWRFHHSQLASHFVQRSSRGRWATTLSTTRKSGDLTDTKSFEFLADIRFMGSSNGITGSYTCQKVGDEETSRSIYVYWEATSPPFLIQQGQNLTAVLDPSTNTTVLPCTVARPDILVALYKGATPNGTVGITWTELKKNKTIQYNSQRGYTLTSLQDPFGPYKCVANSDSKDWATFHVVPSTSPEAALPEFQNVVKFPAKVGYNKATLQLYCCSSSEDAPSMMHFYCDHPSTCRMRKNALLNMENTSTRNGSCAYLRLFIQNAGVFRCVGSGIDVVKEYFFPMGTLYGFGRAFNRNRTKQTGSEEPYLSWTAADPKKMMALRVWANKIYVGQNVTFGCQVSSYFFSKGVRWRLGFANGSYLTVKEALRNSSSAGGFQWFRRNINSLVIRADLNLTSVGCYAPVWNTTEWMNQTVAVNVLVPAKPAIVGSAGAGSVTVMEWYVNDTNKVLECEASGDPLPFITWSKGDRQIHRWRITTPPRTNLSSPNTVVSRLNLSRISLETHGEFSCKAKNLAGSFTRTFQVVVYERTSSAVVVTIVISVLCLLVALGGIVYLVFRIRNQKVMINHLAASAFKELEPNAARRNDVTPDPIFSFPPHDLTMPADDPRESEDGRYQKM